MNHPFDALTAERLRQKACLKWTRYPEEVLPLWVADMDFPIAPAITAAIAEHLTSDNFGYPPEAGLPGLAEALIARLAARYRWQLASEQLLPLSGIVPGLFLGVEALSSVGEEVLLPTPIYGPFLMAVKRSQRRPVHVPLVCNAGRWELDMAALERAVSPATRLLMLCNPHNPVGRVWTREELAQLAEFVLRHRLWVISDELHCELLYRGQRHIPFATLAPEVAARTLTLVGPTKAFNIAGLKIGFAIAENPALMARLKQLAQGRLSAPNVLAQVAARAAYTAGDSWLADTLGYLEGNREALAAFVRQRLPRLRFSPPEGTYLAWLDFRDYGIAEVESFALREAKVALNDGAWFGPGGEGFGRLNFATSRALVLEALARLEGALARYESAA